MGKKNTVRVRCTACGGSGSTPLGAGYQETIDVIAKSCRSRRSNKFTVAHLVDSGLAFLTREAIAMRLRRLQAMGLVKIVERRGRTLVWAKVSK